MTMAVQNAPRVTRDAAARVAADLYGLEVSAEPLPSERDQNFLLRATLSHGSPSRLGHEDDWFVLKIANADEELRILELQNHVIQFLADHCAGLEWPRLLRTRTGEGIAAIKGSDDREHFVRLLTWLDGECFATVRPRSTKLRSS